MNKCPCSCHPDHRAYRPCEDCWKHPKHKEYREDVHRKIEMIDSDLNHRVAVRVMEWLLKPVIDGRKANWFDKDGNFAGFNLQWQDPFRPVSDPVHCDLAIRKMQSDGWEYRRTDVHQFTKEHDWKPEMLVGSVPVGDDNGFNCPEVCEAMLKAKKAEREAV